MHYLTNIEIRLANFRGIVGEHGSSVVRKRLNISRQHLSQYIGVNPTRSIGDDFARRIEPLFGKPRGWLDNVHNRPPFQQIAELAEEIYQSVRIKAIAQESLESRDAIKQNARPQEEKNVKDEKDKGLSNVDTPLTSPLHSVKTRRAR